MLGAFECAVTQRAIM